MYSFKGKREWKHLSDILWLLRCVQILTRKQSEKGISYWKAQTHPETPRGLFRPWLALEIKFVIDTLSWKKKKERKSFSSSNYGYNFRKSPFFLVSNFPTINSVWKLCISYTLKSDDILSMFVYINLCLVLIHSNL